MTQALLVLTNLPDATSAEALASRLVSSGVAACVNQLAPCQSTYAWQGRIEQATEIPLLIKTSATRYADVQALILEMHPYALPEIIALPLTEGLPAYLDWVRQETDMDKSC
ncbi:MAG: divalent-cation tolerance protein CutA [Rhodocyclaceae bacterium]|nr:divalent-cation tolerance protein CutA [Rhodocyclaceae bacterium]